MRLLKVYRKLQLYAPRDLGYLLACKLMIGRPEQDGADIAVLCQTLATQSRAQAQQLVDRYFPSPAYQARYRLLPLDSFARLSRIVEQPLTRAAKARPTPGSKWMRRWQRGWRGSRWAMNRS